MCSLEEGGERGGVGLAGPGSSGEESLGLSLKTSWNQCDQSVHLWSPFQPIENKVGCPVVVHDDTSTIISLFTRLVISQKGNWFIC